MITIRQSLLAQVRNGEATLDELANYLLDSYPVKQIALSLAELLVDTPDISPITVTEQEMNKIKAMFKVRGLREDGTEERRGRKRKDSAE